MDIRCAATAGVLPAVVLMVIAGAACNRNQPETETGTTAPAAGTTAAQRSDSDLSTAVQAKYYTEDELRGRNIQVFAQNGAVTLRGTVQSEAEKQQAVNLARTVEGVTEVNSELEVQEAPATTTAARDPAAARDPEAPDITGTAGRTADQKRPFWITTKIQAQYFVDPDVKPWNIDVTTTADGVVTLAGEVESEQSKTEAVRIARETEGVTRVEDRLRVEAQSRRAGAEREAGDREGISPPDPWLTAKIQAKYFVDESVKGRNIDVDTHNGVVTLKGAVASEAERRQAVALARNTDGVRDVTDQLRVDAGAADRDRTTTEPLPSVRQIDRPDPWITMKVQANYFLDPEVKGHQIDVDTSNGVVTLKGRVDTAQQKQEAEQIARDTAGVKRVVNQLTVGGA